MVYVCVQSKAPEDHEHGSAWPWPCCFGSYSARTSAPPVFMARFSRHRTRRLGPHWPLSCRRALTSCSASALNRSSPRTFQQPLCCTKACWPPGANLMYSLCPQLVACGEAPPIGARFGGDALIGLCVLPPLSNTLLKGFHQLVLCLSALHCSLRFAPSRLAVVFFGKPGGREAGLFQEDTVVHRRTPRAPPQLLRHCARRGGCHRANVAQRPVEQGCPSSGSLLAIRCSCPGPSRGDRLAARRCCCLRGRHRGGPRGCHCPSAPVVASLRPAHCFRRLGAELRQSVSYLVRLLVFVFLKRRLLDVLGARVGRRSFGHIPWLRAAIPAGRACRPIGDTEGQARLLSQLLPESPSHAASGHTLEGRWLRPCIRLAVPRGEPGQERGLAITGAAWNRA